MNKDNHWHHGLVVRDKAGTFMLFDTWEQIEEQSKEHPERFSGGIECQEVLCTWNNGQPKVNFGDFTKNLLDITKTKTGYSSTMDKSNP